MANRHSPLDPATLSAEAQRALTPGPTKMVAARGLAPISDPGDLASVLYQLAADESDGIASAAKQSAAALPDNILKAALANVSVDGRVLDFFVRLVGRDRPHVVELVVGNPSSLDETIAEIAAVADGKVVDRISQNEERMLRHPAIIGAMYNNRAARMSTVDRAVELAIRNSVKVAEIPAWDELVASVMQSGKRGEEPEQVTAEMDALFEMAAQASERGGGEIVEVEGEGEEIPISKMSIPMKIRMATLGNASVRSQLIRDPVRMVCMAAIKSPGMKESEVMKHAGNNSLHEDVIAYIARQREWTKSYPVKASLVRNPKCPVGLSMKLMPHLREKDLRMLAKSKNIPTALGAMARKLVAARSGRK